MNKLIKKIADWKAFYFVWIVSICSIYQILTFGRQFGLNQANDLKYRPFFLLICISFIIMFAILVSGISKRKNPERILVLMIAIFGFGYAVLTPLGAPPDERAHFVRAYSLSQGETVNKSDGKGSVGAMIPATAGAIFDTDPRSVSYSQVRGLLTLQADEQDCTFFDCANISLYAFTCHLPQAIGILIGRVLHLPLYLTALLGRIFNFSVYLLLCAFALKRTPVLKNTMAILMMLPTTLQVSSSLSADAQVLGLCFLIFAFSLNDCIESDHKFLVTNYIRISGLVLFLSLCKIVYLPLALILFLIPSKRFLDTRGRNIKWIFLPALILVAVLLNAIWLRTAMSLLSETVRRATDPLGQIQYIFTNIPRYVLIVLRTMWTDLFQNLQDMVGALQSFDLALSNTSKLALIIVLILSAVLEPRSMDCSVLTRDTQRFTEIYLIALFFAVYIASLTALYVQWTNYGYDLIVGFQGRYWTPILPLILLSLNGRLRIDANVASSLTKYSMFVLSLANLEGLVLIFLRHAVL